MLLLSVGGFFDSIFLFIDGVIYNFVRYACQIFDFLATLNLFDESDYQAIVERIYIILGVVMLFILAYSLLKAVINPDDFSKGDLSVPNLIKNVVISLVIIAVLPTVFTLAFNIQNSFFKNDVIGKLILVPNSTIDAPNDISNDDGGTLSYYAFQAFFHPSIEYCQKKNLEFSECSESITARGGFAWHENYGSLYALNEKVLGGDSFTNYAYFKDEVNNGEIDYSIFVSTVVGFLLALILLSYCVDLGIRVVKLVFYQIIAPIPVICRVLPNQKKIFDTWVKKTISTFLEAFIRIAIMYLGIYLINLIVLKIGDIISVSSINSVSSSGLGITQLLMVRVFLIVGVVLFIRQAPGLIKDLFGFDLGGANPFQRILGMGAAAGAGTTSAIRNFNRSIQSDKGLLRSIGSAFAGGASGTVRGGWAARNAKNLKDMKTGASAGTKGATAAKAKRDAYRASHPGFLGSTKGHVSDIRDRINTWAGAEYGLEDLNAEHAIYQEGMGFKKELFDLVSDDTAVRQYTGLLKSAQEMDVDAYAREHGITRGEALREQKDRIDKYDTAIKIASAAAIQKKLEDPVDARARNIYQKFKTFKKQHSDIASIASLELTGLTVDEVNNIEQALLSDNLENIKTVKKTLENRSGTVLQVDNVFKSENSIVEGKINEKIQEKKSSEGK